MSHVLVVEDNVGDQELLQFAFQEVGDHTVVTFDDGESGLEAIRAAQQDDADPRPDLILLDLKLPLLGGLDILARLRSENTPQRVPIIVLTSSAHRVDMEAAYAAGANGYVVKPIDFEGYKRLVHDLVGYWFEQNRTVGQEDDAPET